MLIFLWLVYAQIRTADASLHAGHNAVTMLSTEKGPAQ
jgi:hypothetical protein